MKKSIVSTIAAVAACTTLLLSPQVVIADAKQGKKLHDSSCIACHDTKIYQRKNRIVNNYDELVHRVQFCESMNQVGWNQKEKESVTQYLNQQFYRFK